jgi:CheY-like chemotaxis protein
VKLSVLLHTMQGIVMQLTTPPALRVKRDLKTRSASRKMAVPAMPAGPKPKILLVEDNQVNQKVFFRLMNKLGFATDSIDLAENGAEAVEKFKRGVLAALGLSPQPSPTASPGPSAASSPTNAELAAGAAAAPMSPSAAAASLSDESKQQLAAAAGASEAGPFEPFDLIFMVRCSFALLTALALPRA